MILTGLLLCSRSMISMLFLGLLGELALAGGSLAVGFANITGYTILSGLAMGMEPICGQAFGAKKHTLLGLSLQRTVLLLLFTSLPISLLWLNMKKILLLCGQDEAIATEAQLYLLCSLPDLLAQSFLHPLRIYLRSQSITVPLTLCATLATILHIPINYLLVSHLDLGIKGVALSGVWSNFNLVASVIVYIIVSGVHKKTWGGISMDCFREWRTLLNLAVPSCISVCLEWWWYKIMILLCGENPDEKTLDLLTSTGESETFLQEAIQEQGRAQVLDTIQQIQERHDAVKDMERNLQEMHQMLLDMAVLLQAQGEQIDDIQNHFMRANSVISRGTRH